MRTCILDIETTDLKADFGRIICAVIKEYGSRREATVYKPTDYKNDKDVVLRIRNRLEDFDIVVGHYSKGFDLPFLNSKLFFMGEKRIKKMFHVDTYYVVKNNMRTISRKSLERIGDTLQLDEKKMNLSIRIWNEARDGNEEAISKICERCLSDVEMTEKVYDSLLRSGMIDTLKRT